MTTQTNPTDWEKITPPSLQPAVDAIRKSFQDTMWKCTRSTEKLCYAALHPAPNEASPTSKDLDAYMKFLTTVIGKQLVQALLQAPNQAHEAAVFKSYLDALETASNFVIQAHFQELLEIAVAQAGILNMDPVEWTKSHLRMLITDEKLHVRTWIKRVCDQRDEQDQWNVPETVEGFYEHCLWKSWRAPRALRPPESVVATHTCLTSDYQNWQENS